MEEDEARKEDDQNRHYNLRSQPEKTQKGKDYEVNLNQKRDTRLTQDTGERNTHRNETESVEAGEVSRDSLDEEFNQTSENFEVHLC